MRRQLITANESEPTSANTLVFIRGVWLRSESPGAADAKEPLTERWQVPLKKQERREKRTKDTEDVGETRWSCLLLLQSSSKLC